MKKIQKHSDEQIPFSERSHSFKLKVVREIENGQISRNFACKKYFASRSSIDYWYLKLRSDMNDNTENKSLKKQIQKLKAEIEEWKFVNQVKTEVIEDAFKRLGEDPKKSYAGQLMQFANELQKKLK
jgi:transposase-like protein